MDEETPKPQAWLRFGVDGPDAIFLSDRTRWSARHREHTWQNRGTIGSDDGGADRYVVAAFPMASAELRPCEACGEPDALVIGAGIGQVLYTGDNLAEAERVFEEAFQ